MIWKKISLVTASTVLLFSVAGCGNDDLNEGFYESNIKQFNNYQKTVKDSDGISGTEYEESIKRFAEGLEHGSSDSIPHYLEAVIDYAYTHPVSLDIASNYTVNLLYKTSSENYLNDLDSLTYAQLLSDYYMSEMVLIAYEQEYILNENNPDYEKIPKFKTKEGEILSKYKIILHETLIFKKSLAYNKLFDSATYTEKENLVKLSKPYAKIYFANIENKKPFRDKKIDPEDIILEVPPLNENKK